MNWSTSSTISPIGLMLSDRKTWRVIRNIGDVARVLLTDWPTEDGEEYMSAVKACVDAISGRVDAEEVGTALLRAATEAGLVALSVLKCPNSDVTARMGCG